MKKYLKKIKNTIYILGFPFYSLVSRKVGFCVFFRSKGCWFAFTHGQVFPVREPRLWALEYFRHFVPPKAGLVFDVGGEQGFETEQFSKMVGSNGRVFVFECLPDHVARLRKLAGERQNITVVERACWNEETSLEFFVGRTPGSNTAVPETKGQRGQALADENKEKIVVEAETLDNLWQTLVGSRSIDFLKMDIEGAEYEALEGAVELLRYTRYAVIAAYHIRDGMRTADKVAAMLKKAGFIVRIDENDHVYAKRRL